VSASDYASGLLALGVVVAGFLLTGCALAARALPGWRGAPAALGRAVLSLSVAIVTCEALGIVGLLDSPALIAAATLPAAALYIQGKLSPAGREVQSRIPERAAVALAIAGSLLAAVHWAGPVLHSYDVGIYRQDSTWYHLPFAAWFAQTGSISGLLLTDPLKLAVWYYPLNSELLHSVGMVLLGNDALSPLLNFGWMAVALLAAWCIGRPFGLAAATLLGALVVVDSDMMLVQAGNAPSDIVALACLLACAAILLQGWADREPAAPAPGGGLPLDAGPLFVAALAGGLAIGAKVTMLVPIGVLSVGILVLAGSGGRARRAAVWLGGLCLTGGFWYLRNFLHAGNPLPWITIGPLPGPAQEPLYPRPAHSIADYIADHHAWSAFLFPGFEQTLGPLWFFVVFAAGAGIILGLRPRHGALIRILALAGAATLLAHVFNPISASGPAGAPYGFASNLRYAAPGIAIGLILLPLCETRWTVRRIIVPAYALLLAVAALASSEWIAPNLAAALGLGALAVFVPLYLLRGRSSLRGKVILAALATILLVAGYPLQRHYFDNRYRPDIAPPLDTPGFRSTPQWDAIQAWAREQRGLRIGIVGAPAAYGQYVFYGKDLSNRVRYLGEPGPHGALTPIQSCRRWRESLAAGHFDAVVITPEAEGPLFLPSQIGWTEAGGLAIPVVRAFPAAVFLLAGRPNPSQCRDLAPPGEHHGPLGPGFLHGMQLGPGLVPQLQPEGAGR
jgi:hypothetical protein